MVTKARDFLRLIKLKLMLFVSRRTPVLGNIYLYDNGINKFLIQVDDQASINHLLNSWPKIQSEIDYIKQISDQDSSILIVGANIGTIALSIAKFVKSVVAIEANPDTKKILDLNVCINNLKNVTTYNFAASDSNKKISFLKSTHNSGGSKRVPIIQKKIYYYDLPEEISIEGKKLDDIFSQKFDIILMDIEGSEIFALKGSPRLLNQADYLVIEFIPHHLRNVAVVTVDELLENILPYFSRLYIPSKKQFYYGQKIYDVLRSMYVKEEYDDGIIFSKKKDIYE
jgi:FkbM family methyltransferase